MKIERLNIADLRPAEKNTRIHNRKQIDELVRSFRMFGQIRPIIVDESNVIWCGNGFYEAAKQAGETEIDAYRIVGLDEKQKRKPTTRAGAIWQTYVAAVRSMIGPMLIFLGGMSVVFLLIWIILGFFA